MEQFVMDLENVFVANANVMTSFTDFNADAVTLIANRKIITYKSVTEFILFKL